MLNETQVDAILIFMQRLGFHCVAKDAFVQCGCCCDLWTLTFRTRS